MTENDRKPDNTLAAEINGTKFIIHEYFGGKDTMNNVIMKQVLNYIETTPQPLLHP